jgi:hypothetical protein
LGNGNFRAAVSSNCHGWLNGRAELNMLDFTSSILDGLNFEAKGILRFIE